MTYENIMELLNKGFSPDQVMQLMQAPEPAPEPEPEPAPEPAPEPEPEPAPEPDRGNAAILAALDKLTKSVQAAALFGARQPDPRPAQTPTDIILSTIKARQGIKEESTNG